MSRLSALARAKVRRAVRRTPETSYAVWSVTRAGRANLGRVRALRGTYEGRRCVVMGNGPSLLKSDLNGFADDVTIASNAHFLIWDKLTYRPTFLTVEDRLVAEDRADELASVSGVTKVFPFDLRHLLPAADEQTIYLNFARDYLPFPQFSHDISRRVYWGGTVSFLNLQLAAYLGCNPIILVGFDHSYAVPTTQMTGSVIESTEPDVNHIHPDYFGPGYRWHDPNVARMEEGYRCARSALERAGVRVVNATVGGHLEVFERGLL